jgi:hypothetical protein
MSRPHRHIPSSVTTGPDCVPGDVYTLFLDHATRRRPTTMCVSPSNPSPRHRLAPQGMRHNRGAEGGTLPLGTPGPRGGLRPSWLPGNRCQREGTLPSPTDTRTSLPEVLFQGDVGAGRSRGRCGRHGLGIRHAQPALPKVENCNTHLYVYMRAAQRRRHAAEECPVALSRRQGEMVRQRPLHRCPCRRSRPPPTGARRSTAQKGSKDTR